MISLTVHISHPDVVCGDARTALYNSIAQTFEVLGPEWTHKVTTMNNGNLIIYFERIKGDDTPLPTGPAPDSGPLLPQEAYC